MPSRRVMQLLTDLAGRVTSLRGLPQVLVQQCSADVPVSGAGLALMADGSPAGTVAVTDAAAEAVESLQFTVGEGPCIDAAAAGRPVLHPDLAATGPSRWPAFSAGALEAGIGAVFAFPLRVGGIRLGVLDLYRVQTGPLSATSLEVALTYADAATLLVLQLQQEQPDGAPGAPWHTDHAEVHQATGMVAVQARTNLADALLLLRARAYADQVPVDFLARRVLSGAVVFEEER